jgi:dephospho-CoA kinase
VLGANGAVDRAKLGAIVFGDPKALQKLESILHPLLAKGRRRFLAEMHRRRMRIAVFDVPLLFETNAAGLYDRVVVVSSPAFLQRQRAMARPGMNAAKLAGILRRQMPDAEKRRRADFVVPTGAGKRVSLRRWKQILERLKADA